jgi:hypothetical protein
MKAIMQDELRSYSDRLLFAGCILLGWLATELAQTMY